MLEAHNAREVELNYATINLREANYLPWMAPLDILLVQSVCMRMPKQLF